MYVNSFGRKGNAGLKYVEIKLHCTAMPVAISVGVADIDMLLLGIDDFIRWPDFQPTVSMLHHQKKDHVV